MAHQGGNDSPDVSHDIPSIYIEVKFREKFSLYPALNQALIEGPPQHAPVVFHRRNNKPWVVVLYADDFLEMMERLYL